MNEILSRLGLGEVNAGTWSGSDASESDDADLINSINPASGELIARDGFYKQIYELQLLPGEEVFLEAATGNDGDD